MTLLRTQFPTDFRWGVATSSYQIEGAANTDGRTPSIWDTFAHTPGKTSNGNTGDVACDHYHLFEQDTDLMQRIGVNAYRFSTSWSRVLPNGRGQVNAKGIDFYSRLVDALLERGIEPWLTLYHWDLPQVLEDAGGWGHRDTAYAFAEYAEVMAKHLGDRVKNFMTHNEPWCTAFLGHHTGYFAPGKKDLKLALQVVHHLLLSHGLAVPVIRANSSESRVGAALNLWTVEPASEQPEDVIAAKRYDGHCNRWFLDPLYGRGYPTDLLEWYGSNAPSVQPGDFDIIKTPTDFLGMNYYLRMIVKANSSDEFLQCEIVKPEGEYTDIDWEVHPLSLQQCLERMGQEYPVKALYITENGACYNDDLIDGVCDDARRVSYLNQYIAAARDAIGNGAPLKGYFAWSLMDNFEWASGYTPRFGLVHVDFATQKRTLKSSGQWYSQLLKPAI
jgi:beta-glucosidase